MKRSKYIKIIVVLFLSMSVFAGLFWFHRPDKPDETYILSVTRDYKVLALSYKQYVRENNPTAYIRDTVALAHKAAPNALKEHWRFTAWVRHRDHSHIMLVSLLNKPMARIVWFPHASLMVANMRAEGYWNWFIFIGDRIRHNGKAREYQTAVSQIESTLQSNSHPTSNRKE